MYPVFVLLVAIALIHSPVVFSAHQSLPVAVVEGAEGDTCPSDQDIDVPRENLMSGVRSLLQGVMIVPECGEGVWKKVVSLNMSDPSQECPSPWREYTSIRSCGRPVGSSGCELARFTVNNYKYTKVCGRAIGYQYYSPDGFGRLIPLRTNTPDDNYVDGLSVTHGRFPRKHIWTFAVGLNEPNENTNPQQRRFACPCAAPDGNFGTTPPSYVGENYFCESGHFAPNWSRDHHSDPLWDGEGCLNSQCCSFNTPPWFSVRLPTATRDDIEVRICGDQNVGNEDTTVELLEIYIQ